VNRSRYFDCQCSRCIDEEEHILSSLRCIKCEEPVTLLGRTVATNNENKIVCKKCNVRLHVYNYYVVNEQMQTVCTRDRINEGTHLMRTLDEILDTPKAPQTRDDVDALMAKCDKILSSVNVYGIRVVQLAIKYTQQTELERMLNLHLKVYIIQIE
jgi:hypothetical protein